MKRAVWSPHNGHKALVPQHGSGEPPTDPSAVWRPKCCSRNVLDNGRFLEFLVTAGKGRIPQMAENESPMDPARGPLTR